MLPGKKISNSNFELNFIAIGCESGFPAAIGAKSRGWKAALTEIIFKMRIAEKRS